MINILNSNANRLPLPDGCVHTIVTSPPYWGLRDYGLPPTVWGGEKSCDHVWEATVEPGGNGDGETSRRDRAVGRKRGRTQPGYCIMCGAWKGCLGLEPTPELFVQNMIEVGREWWRVLRDDGTLWLNMGDTYSGGNNGRNDAGRIVEGKPIGRKAAVRKTNRIPPGLKGKDLIGIPFMLAMALRADGWYWRATIPWVKKNAMPPGGITDRPGVSHEYIFLFSKSKSYYYDTTAVRMPPADYHRPGGTAPYDAASGLTHGKGSSNFHQMAANGRLRRTGDWYSDSVDSLIEQTEDYLAHLRYVRDNGGMMLDEDGSPAAMLVNTRQYKGAHFAAFPPGIVEPCIKAATSEHGVCARCGAQWRRITKEELVPTKGAAKTFVVDDRDLLADKNDQGSNRQKNGHKSGHITQVETVGWEPTCECGCDEVEPAVVLDSFAGSGTTGETAVRLRRRSILVDLNLDYLTKLATVRTDNVQMVLPV